MRHFLLATLLSLSVFLSACSDDDEKSTTLIFTPTATISNSETLTYDMGVFGDPELTTITHQAEYAEVSEILVHPETGEVFYRYKPQAGFIGRDYVHVMTETGPLGDPDSSPIIIAKITIEVSY